MSWDDVKEWLERLDGEGDDLVASTLVRIAAIPPEQELEHVACEQAIAAAEIVASSAGAAPDTLPPRVHRYVEHHGVPEEEVVLAAFRAVERIGMQRDEHDAWLVDLEERLGALLSA